MAQVSSQPSLADYVEELGLPADFAGRATNDSTSVKTVWTTFEAKVTTQKFLPGLFLAFIAMAERLLAQIDKASLDSALSKYPPATVGARGQVLRTLTLSGPKGKIAVRGLYEKAESVVLYRLRRPDYPNMAPTASWSWSQFRSELEAIFAMTPGERLALAERLWAHLLALPEAPTRPVGGITVRPFSRLLREFPNTQKGEPPGAILQGLAFAYYRADAPNVTLETSKVGAGRARLGGVGDIDGWTGGELVLSVEVKDYVIAEANLDELAGFFKNLEPYPDATSIVLARSFTDEARTALQADNVLVLDRDAMAQNVALWDLRKQEIAIAGFEYFLRRVQKHTRLTERFFEFMTEDESPDEDATDDDA